MRRRLFFALWLDERTAQAAHQAAEAVARQFGGRIMRQDSLHLTLAFLGDTPGDQVSTLMAQASELATQLHPFTLNFDRLGYWPRNHIVWASCRDAANPLHQLSEQLGDRLRHHGCPPDPRPFHPHVTLLRNVPPIEEALACLAPIHFRVEEFRLVESMSQGAGGSRHETVACWPLGTGRPAK